MPSHIFTIGLLVWIIWQAWKGFKQGVWGALLSVLGLLIAYIVSFFWGQSFAGLISSYGVKSEYAVLMAYPVIFIVISQAVRYIPPLLFPILASRSRFHALAGACVGVCSGTISGLIMVWFVGFMSNVLQRDDSKSVQTADVEPEFVQTLSSDFVAKTAEVGLIVISGDKVKAHTIAAIIRQPDEILIGAQEVMKSQALKHFMNSVDIQSMMAINDVNSLRQSEHFHTLMQHPGMQKMTSSLHVEGKTELDSERYIAEQLTFVWRRLQYLKHDPRVKEILNDPAIKHAIESNKPVSLMTNTQFQRLVGIVMEEKVDMSEIDFTQFINTDTLQDNDSSHVSDNVDEKKNDAVFVPKPYAPSKVYKWTDDNGKVRYSDWENIPKNKLNTADVLIR